MDKEIKNEMYVKYNPEGTRMHITKLGREKMSVAKISVTQRELDALRYVISQIENYEFDEPQSDGEIPVAIGLSVGEMDALIDLGKEVRKISSDLIK